MNLRLNGRIILCVQQTKKNVHFAFCTWISVPTAAIAQQHWRPYNRHTHIHTHAREIKCAKRKKKRIKKQTKRRTDPFLQHSCLSLWKSMRFLRIHSLRIHFNKKTIIFYFFEHSRPSEVQKISVQFLFVLFAGFWGTQTFPFNPCLHYIPY